MRDANLFDTNELMAGAQEPQAEVMAEAVQMVSAAADVSVESYVPFADMPVLDRLRTCD
jgi:hypothetical protein